MKKSLLLLTILFPAFFLFSAFNTISENYFEIGSKKWNLQSAIIANESYGINSKFELDLLSDKRELSEAKTFIWLSLTSTGTEKITEGVYKFSQASLNDRAPFGFNGAVHINGEEIKIDNGSFSLETFNEAVSVHFVLELANGNIVKGNYKGPFSSVDRRR